MRLVPSAVLSAALAVAAFAAPGTATAGCANCYVPQPCYTCYQQPKYRAVEETVMVRPGRVVAHRTPAEYATVMVPKTVMVRPAGVQYEEVPAEYATRQRYELVAPAYYYRSRCGNCGW